MQLRVLTWLAVGGSALVLSMAAARAQVATVPDAQDFPMFDAAALSLQRTGLEARRAARALVESPDDPETARLLAAQRRLSDALVVLGRIVERHPGRIAAAFDQLGVFSFRIDATKPYATDLLALVRDARTRIATLPREEQARTAYALLRTEGQLDHSETWESRLRTFVAGYAGTETARLAEVDVITASSVSAGQLDALDAFATKHPGTVAAAKALFQKGFHLAHNQSALRIERRGDDPTPRFNRTMDVMRELESGRYPPCEWVKRAPELLTGFFMYQPTFSTAGNLNAMLATYQAFVARELPRDPANLPGSTLAYVITSKMGQLHALAGRDLVAGVEQELAALERLSPQPGAVRLLRAQFYLQNLVELPDRRAMLIAKARSTLEELAGDGAEPFARRALATLASLHFHEREYEAAAQAYRRYLAKYPASDWAWVATLRLGQSQSEAGDTTEAAATFAGLAARSGAEPFARVLGHVAAAETLASLGQVAPAARHAELALQLWDDDFGPTYRVQGRQVLRPGDEPLALPRDTEIVKAALPARIAELRESAAVPGGDALERGRALIRRGRFNDARLLLERAATDARGTALEPAARSLAHRARLEDALTRIDIPALDALSAEPVDFPVVAARIARATLGAITGDQRDADALVSAALNAWRTQQPSSPAPAPDTLDADLLAIRNALFRPLGGGIYDKGRWNAFSFPATLPPFLIVNPTMRVTMPDETVRHVTLRRAIDGLSNVLFLDDDQLALMATMIRTLGGTDRRQPAQIMETPNQPAGRAVTVRDWWNRFFPMRQGHWSGWVFETYPIIHGVTFSNAERTRASVRVEVGYSGGTVLLEKQAGTWRVVDIVNLWVT